MPVPTRSDRPPRGRSQRAVWLRLDARNLTQSERLNPLIVKKIWQVCRERSFGGAYVLTLLAAWGGTAFTVAVAAPGLETREFGPDMLPWHVGLLAVVALVLAPFSAFFQSSVEFERSNAELLMISTMPAARIAGGHLSAILVPTLLVLSALVPYVAFDYLLGGVSVVGLLVVAAYLLLVGHMMSAWASVLGAWGGRSPARGAWMLLCLLVSVSLTGPVVVAFTIWAATTDWSLGGAAASFGVLAFVYHVVLTIMHAFLEDRFVPLAAPRERVKVGDNVSARDLERREVDPRGRSLPGPHPPAAAPNFEEHRAS